MFAFCFDTSDPVWVKTRNIRNNWSKVSCSRTQPSGMVCVRTPDIRNMWGKVTYSRTLYSDLVWVRTHNILLETSTI